MSFFQMDPKKILKKHHIDINNVQTEIIESVNKYKVTVCNCSRRSGKTLLASACASAVALIPNANVAITAPLSSMTDIMFRNVDNIMSDSLLLPPTKKDNKQKIMGWDWGSFVTCTTLKNMKSVLGKANDLVIVEEAALADYLDSTDFIFRELLPTLLTTGGHMLIISSPRGKNYFSELVDNCAIEDDWNYIEFSIWDIDHVPHSEKIKLQKQYKRLGKENMFKQEYECSFIAQSGTIFDYQPIVIPDDRVPDSLVTAVGIDPGLHFAAVKVKICQDGIYITGAYEQQASTTEHGEFLQGFCSDSDLTVIDGAAAQVREDLVYTYDLDVTNAIKDVEAGIGFLRCLDGLLFITASASRLVMEQWSNYIEVNGKIKKKDDHTLDAIRYSLYTLYKIWPEYYEHFTFKEYKLPELQ